MMMRRGLRLSFLPLLGPGSPALLHPASLLAPAGESSVDKLHLSVGLVVGFILFLVNQLSFGWDCSKRYQNLIKILLSIFYLVKPNNCEDASLIYLVNSIYLCSYDWAVRETDI